MHEEVMKIDLSSNREQAGKPGVPKKKKKTHHNSKRYVHPSVHSSTVYSNQDMETT